jgi:putative endonuclease
MKKTGDYGEDLAARHLESKGYRILERKWRGKKGFKSPEIDIIAELGETLVFVEVKTASTAKFGAPQEWINPAKRVRMAEGAKAYLAVNELPEKACRFDAILVDKSVKPTAITHIENAFSLSDIDL